MKKEFVISILLMFSLGVIIADGPPVNPPQQFFGDVSYSNALIYDGCSIELRSDTETSNCQIKNGKYGYLTTCFISSENKQFKAEFFIEGEKIGERQIFEVGKEQLDFNLSFSPTCATPPSNPDTNTNTNTGGGGGGGGGSSSTTKVVTLTGNDDKNITNLSTTTNLDSLKSSETQSRDIKAGDEKENLLSFLSKGNVAMWLIVFIIVLALFVGVKAKSKLKEDKNIQAEISKIAKGKSK